MAVVARGLGLPDDGSLVSGGLGVSGVGSLNAMTATLSGSGSLAATLTTIGVASTGGTPHRRQRAAVYASAQAALPVAVRSIAVGDVAAAVAASAVVERVSWSLLPALAADITARAASSRLAVVVGSSATSVRSTSSSAVSLTRVSVSAVAVGEIAWSVLDEEDELLLLLAT